MALKNKIRRAVRGTCVVVETCSEVLPSRVRVTVQRPRGGSCLCLGKTSRQVAMFTFNEEPCNSMISNALLDLEKLFKYSRMENTQIKICVEQRQGGRRVARVPLEEFMEQLLCNGPCDWFFLHVHEKHVTMTPRSHSDPENVPKWAFEAIGSFHAQEKEDQSNHNEETACVTLDDVKVTTMNDTVKDSDECVLQNQEEHKYVQNQEESKEECVKYVQNQEETKEEFVTLQVTLPDEDYITGQEETLFDKHNKEEESGNDWIICCLKRIINDNKLSQKDKEEEFKELWHKVFGTTLPDDNITGHEKTLSDEDSHEEELDEEEEKAFNEVWHEIFSIAEEENHDFDEERKRRVTEQHLDNNTDQIIPNQISDINSLRDWTTKEEEEALSENEWITEEEESLSENEWITEEEESLSENDGEQNCDKDRMTYSGKVKDKDKMTAMLNKELEKEVASLRTLSLFRLFMSYRGAIIVGGFVTLATVFQDTLHDLEMDRGWPAASLVLCCVSLTILLLLFFERENYRLDIIREL